MLQTMSIYNAAVSASIIADAELNITKQTGEAVKLVLLPGISNKTPESMMRLIAAVLGMNFKEYASVSRRTPIIDLRCLAAYFLRSEFPDLSLKGIAKLFAGQHHTTIISLLKRANNLLKTNDHEFCAKHQAIVEALKQWEA